MNSLDRLGRDFDLVSAYEGGANALALAKRFSLCRESVYRILHGWEVELRPPVWPQRTPKSGHVEELENGHTIITPAFPRDGQIIAAAMTGEYTLQQLGTAFNLTRERVRQILARNNMKNQQFRRLRGQEIPFEEWLQTREPIERRKMQSRARRKRVRRRQVETLKNLARELRRTPTLGELAKACGYNNVIGLIGCWRKRHGQARIATSRLYRLAGLKVRGVGPAGHLD